MMFKKKKKKSKDQIEIQFNLLALLIFFVSLTTVFFAYLLGQLSNIFSSILPKSFIVGTQDGWLSLLGALGGGAMTLFGVWWTIQDQSAKRKEDYELQEEKRKMDLAIQYRPIVELTQNKISGELRKADSPHTLIRCSFILRNTGRGEAMNCTFKIEPGIGMEASGHKLLECSSFGDEIKALTSNSERTIRSLLYFDLNQKISTCDLYLTISYTDAFSNKLESRYVLEYQIQQEEYFIKIGPLDYRIL